MPTWHTALRWAKAGKIPGAVHMHGAWHVDLDAYEQAVASQTAAGEKTTEAGGAGIALAKRLEGMG
jgi:predicted site-specific integrase-resolvase